MRRSTMTQMNENPGIEIETGLAAGPDISNEPRP